MAWCQIGKKPLPNPMLTNIFDVIIALLGLNELIVWIEKVAKNDHLILFHLVPKVTKIYGASLN